MSFATNTTAVLAALGLLTAGPVMAQSTAGQPSSETSPSGGMQSGQTAEDISDSQLRDYARIWRQVQTDKTSQELASALQSGGDLSGKEQDISTALATTGSSMSVEEFEQVHQRVQGDPSLQARIQEETGVSVSGSAAGTSGTTDQSGMARPGAGAPLPSGALGTGPASVEGGIPPGTKEPGLGTGAPVPSGSEGNDGTSDGAAGGSGSGGTGGSDTTQ